MSPFKDLPEGKTHWEGCWKDPDHPECKKPITKMRDVFALPLKAKKRKPTKADHYLEADVREIYDAHGDYRFEAYSKDQADAIVLAVNEHDKLTRQLEVAVGALDAINEEEGCNYLGMVAKALAEIKKIEEEK